MTENKSQKELDFSIKKLEIEINSITKTNKNLYKNLLTE
jgi:hypothetical protein